MKIVYGYQENGKFLIATVQDDCMLDNVDEIKQTVDSVSSEGESYVEIDRPHCLKISKHMQFGKKGDIRTVEIES